MNSTKIHIYVMISKMLSGDLYNLSKDVEIMFHISLKDIQLDTRKHFVTSWNRLNIAERDNLVLQT